MSPLVGLSVLLKNPLVREQMKFDESELTVDEKAAGISWAVIFAKQERALLPVMPGGAVLSKVATGTTTHIASNLQPLESRTLRTRSHQQFHHVAEKQT